MLSFEAAVCMRVEDLFRHRSASSGPGNQQDALAIPNTGGAICAADGGAMVILVAIVARFIVDTELPASIVTCAWDVSLRMWSIASTFSATHSPD